MTLFEHCHLLLWQSFIKPRNLTFNMLYKLRCIVFTTVHFQWIKNITINKKNAVYISCSVHMCWSFPYIGLYLFTQSSNDSPSLYSFDLATLRCFHSMSIEEMEPWTNTYHSEILTNFLFENASWIDATIASAIFKVLASCWRCAKAIKENVICFFTGCIQRFK